MHCYRFDGGGALVSAGEADGVLRVMTAEEYRAGGDAGPHRRQMLHGLGSIRYSKAEVYSEAVQGLLRIPQRRDGREPYLALGFCLDRERLTFIESAGHIKALPELLRDRLTEPAAPDKLLLLFLESVSDGDTLYLQHLEESMTALEEDILADGGKEVFSALMGYRRKLSELNAYYVQMGGVGELMATEAEPFVHSAAAWTSFVRRMERLQRYAALLGEYAVQLREIYQAQQDAKQNRTMSILTVVTTLFLPLTLLTGWYGMNFAHMPELHWRYSYPAVMVLAAVIVVAEIIYFKKKKML